MIRWITQEMGTARWSGVDHDKYNVIDVRDLVDRQGNPQKLILERIQRGANLLKEGKKIVICCDCGLSRSNAIAAGVLVRYYKYDFKDAVERIIEKTGGETIQIGMLDSLMRVLRITAKNPDNKKILILGASGFIGSALADSLRKEYKLITPGRSEIDLLKGPLKLDFLVKRSGAGLIVDLAAPRIYTTTRAMGEMIVMFKNVLDVCGANSIPVICFSSYAVLGQPKDTYGQSKLLCESLLTRYRKAYGLKSCLLRLGLVYGPGGDKSKFVWRFIEKAIKGSPIYTHQYKNGLPVLDLIHIDDVVSAVRAAIKVIYRGTLPGFLHIGSGRGISTFEVAKEIKDICGSKSRILRRKIGGLAPKSVMDIKKAKKALNWEPKVTLENGLRGILSGIKSKNLK